jgi:hypothetical protein
MWIDTERLRVDDFDPNEPSEGEPLTDEEWAELDALDRDEVARREEMERDLAAMDWEATEEYPF